MNQETLQKKVESLSLKYFNKPFLHKAVFNSRLRTTGGRYHLNTHHLDFNPRVFKHFDERVVDGIIKHELCHYHLHLEGKGYRHGDQDFKVLLAEVGALRYTPSLELKQEDVSRWEYECTGCKTRVYRRRRFNTQKFICSKCKERFILIGRKQLERSVL